MLAKKSFSSVRSLSKSSASDSSCKYLEDLLVLSATLSPWLVCNIPMEFCLSLLGATTGFSNSWISTLLDLGDLTSNTFTIFKDGIRGRNLDCLIVNSRSYENTQFRLDTAWKSTNISVKFRITKMLPLILGERAKLFFWVNWGSSSDNMGFGVTKLIRNLLFVVNCCFFAFCFADFRLSFWESSDLFWPLANVGLLSLAIVYINTTNSYF